MSKDIYACFTDIAGSTNATKTQGNKPYDDIKKRHFAVLDKLADKYQCSFKNSTGDGRLIVFDSLDNVLSFSTNLRFCCGSSSSRSPKDIKIRISIAHGPAETSSGGNVSGEVVNFAARLNGIDNFEDIIVCAETAENLRKTYGESIANSFLTENSIDLKDYKNTTFYALSPSSFSSAIPDASFQKDVQSYLDRLGITFSNIELYDLLLPNTIIWPVVPRAYVNLIHHGMIEILTLFALQNWEIKILIADSVGMLCTVQSVDTITQNFKSRIEKIFFDRDINVSVITLSSMFSNENKDTCCAITKGTLFDYIAPLKVADIDKIINKNYAERDRVSPTKSSWSLMRPFFTLAATINIQPVDEERKKIILSGEDELLMWERCTKQHSYEKKIGSLHLPMLKNVDGKQLSLENNDLYWQSSTTLYQEFVNNNNMAKWAMNMVVAPSRYPLASDTFALDGGVNINMDIICNEQENLPDQLLRPLARDVYNNHLVS